MDTKPESKTIRIDPSQIAIPESIVTPKGNSSTDLTLANLDQDETPQRAHSMAKPQ